MKIRSATFFLLPLHPGIKFTFGTNNVDADFGKLEYCLQAVDECGLTAEDLWFPTMSVRGTREVVLYNKW